MFRVVLCAALVLNFWPPAPSFAQPTTKKAPAQAASNPPVSANSLTSSHNQTTSKPANTSFPKKTKQPKVLPKKKRTKTVPLPPPGTKHKAPQFRTFRTFGAAVAMAQQLKRPIFLDLFAIWCVPCKRLEHDTFSHPLIHPLLAKYLVVRFDIDQPEGRKLTKRFRVGRFPTTLILDQNGRETERIIGYYTARFFRPAIVAGLLGKGTFSDLIREVQKSPNNKKMLLQLADRAVLHRKVDLARQMYQKLWKADSKNQAGVGAWALFGIARSYTRVGMYAYALPWLEHFHKQFNRPTKAQIEAYRLQIYTLNRMRQHKKRIALLKVFKRLFKGKSHVFK